MLRLILCGLALGLAAGAVAAPQVRVVGLFADAAVLSIDGQRTLVRAGQTGPGGVEVLQADSRSALLRIDGVEQRLTLDREYNPGGYSAPERQRLTLTRKQDGHYWATGAINGYQMRFLLDTGASSVALNAAHAQRLGIDYRRGKPLQVTTASGVEKGWLVVLRSVKLAELEVTDVEAVVLEGTHPEEALLGMSFLKQVSWRQEQDSLILESRF